MPRENRKRGKKHKKPAQDAEFGEQEHTERKFEPEPEAGPSWIVANPQQDQVDSEAPFGYLDADVKAYFRTVDVQIRQWQDGQVEVDEDEKHTFFLAALTEMTGKEKQLATDPDCSVILERMLHSMDDFSRRVFTDSLAGSYEILARHRFASHVCQTLLEVAEETVSRETKGILPEIPQTSSKTGHLPKITELVLDTCDELLPVLPQLLHDSFGSHIVRALALLLSPASNIHSQTSKRSKSWKGKQGEMRSLFSSEKSKEDMARPSSFKKAAKKIVRAFRDGMSDNEVRACAGSKVACPGLDVLIEVEAKHGLSNERSSLMDRVLVGMVGQTSDSSTPLLTTESDYIHTLLRDATSSHLLETVVTQAPQPVFDILWNTYLCPNNGIERLATHAVSNYVLARAVSRANTEQLGVLGTKWWGRAVEMGRLGVVKAIVERTAEVGEGGEDIWQALQNAFGFEDQRDPESLIKSVISLKTFEDYKSANTPPEPNVQGALLLQSVLRLKDPHNATIIESILSLPVAFVITLAQHPVSSRVLDAFLDSPTVPHKAKRQFVLIFLGHFHELVDNRIGSRVGERCWSWADTYMKEKIARSVMEHEKSLAASYYGKFFVKALNLYTLKRRPEEWRDMIGKAKTKEVIQPEVKEEKEAERPKRKRKHEQDKEVDEIEMVFKKARKKGALERPVEGEAVPKHEKHTGVLDARVMEAIRSAPGEGKKKRK
ncbi:ARM repeat-containing protein [Guyanagaster necrorhizus]|uniref:Nucleolar protein 9 n=1 Tax=Guyanagaster necrorhizus TaxID=856835 RepID=A0A9P7VU97_9AGAR|nr:ARM repeat-containing protein [Guyanagaster necrorhizus MCA 3950]KAG7446006.1 ARM repeat-containing protein [Guyanagaster necrorhizus MCA 3950]